jgi:hypothetical protein
LQAFNPFCFPPGVHLRSRIPAGASQLYDKNTNTNKYLFFSQFRFTWSGAYGANPAASIHIEVVVVFEIQTATNRSTRRIASSSNKRMNGGRAFLLVRQRDYPSNAELTLC